MGDATVDAAAALDELELGSFLDSLATAAGYLIAAGSVALYAPIAARVAWQGRASADGLSLATWCAIAVAPSHTRVRRSCFFPSRSTRNFSLSQERGARLSHSPRGRGGGRAEGGRSSPRTPPPTRTLSRAVIRSRPSQRRSCSHSRSDPRRERRDGLMDSPNNHSRRDGSIGSLNDSQRRRWTIGRAPCRPTAQRCCATHKSWTGNLLCREAHSPADLLRPGAPAGGTQNPSTSACAAFRRQPPSEGDR